jgi:hypothetical protein
MKTPEEWVRIYNSLSEEEPRLREWIKQIQLDAYRAGGLAAAGMCIGYKNHGDTHPPIETRRAILTHFNDPKLEIPE